mgnify:CR=1 FL=1
MLDIVVAIEPMAPLSACPLNVPEHGTSLCRLHQSMDEARARWAERLAGTTLRQVLEPASAERCPFPQKRV